MTFMKDEKNKSKFGRRIKELRVSQSLSQEDLCNRGIGIEPDYLSKIERGKYAPSVILLEKIIRALNVTPNQFFDNQHLMSEEELDFAVIEDYKSFSLKKKRTLYRYIQILKEYN